MPVGSCQLLGRCLLLRLVLLGRSICPTADMLMRVNEIKQSQRELLIGIGRGECTTAVKGECQDGAVEGARGGRGRGVLERASVKHSIWQTTRTYQHNTHNMCMSVSRDMRGIAHSMLVSSHSFLCPHTHTLAHTLSCFHYASTNCLHLRQQQQQHRPRHRRRRPTNSFSAYFAAF